MEQENFRTALQKEFLRRQDKNPSYSLRAFSRSLSVDPGSLSQFLNGHRNFSEKKLKRLSMLLGFDLEEVNREPELLTPDRFHLLGRWYNMAILECLELDDFEPNPEWIAKKIHLNVAAVGAAINQLLSHGVLTLNPDGSWQNNWQEFTTQENEDVDDLALREHQKQLLEIARTSIDTHSAEEKSHTAYISAIDSDLVDEIKEDIRQFRKKIAKKIRTKSKKKDDVYCMQLNFFSETRKKEYHE